MSSDPNTPDNILGQEFLTWLWYRSDTSPDAFADESGAPFAVSMEQRMTVEGGDGDNHETAAVSGACSPLREARVGLATGKKVTRSLLQLTRDDFTYSVVLRAEDFSLNSLKTPKVEKPGEDDDPDAMVLEKIALLETATGMLDSLYLAFLRVRLDDAAWARECAAIGRWAARTE
ncbi:MAG: hypothetical protein Q4F72_09415 [Desulfovibrionaceae bacterium]|nr:hypothetical protein [Desulfovibrionaceae bacterium]